MAKGDDALRKKKNKIIRKRMRSSDAAVPLRIAAIIASKRRRMAGKRRACEGMCFSLPTPDDPFLDNKNLAAADKKRPAKKRPAKKLRASKTEGEAPSATGKSQLLGEAGGGDAAVPRSLTKFVLVCLNAIQADWEAADGRADIDMESRDILSIGEWGVELWRVLDNGSDVVDTSGPSATKDQIGWVVSLASDAYTKKENRGVSLDRSPYLIYLVPTQRRAAEVRSVCKPLKRLGIHTVSLHPGAEIGRQIDGLKSCEPEFIVSTPKRFLELLSCKAIDVSETSLLVLDGLRSLIESGSVETIKSIKESFSSCLQTVVFGDCFEEEKEVVQDLLQDSFHQLSLQEYVTS